MYNKPQRDSVKLIDIKKEVISENNKNVKKSKTQYDWSFDVLFNLILYNWNTASIAKNIIKNEVLLIIKVGSA